MWHTLGGAGAPLQMQIRAGQTDRRGCEDIGQETERQMIERGQCTSLGSCYAYYVSCSGKMWIATGFTE